MRALYGSQDVWALVESGYSELVQVEETNPQQILKDKENKKRDIKALFFIFQAVDETWFPKI